MGIFSNQHEADKTITGRVAGQPIIITHKVSDDGQDGVMSV